MQIAILCVTKAENVQPIDLNAPMVFSSFTPCLMINLAKTGEECIFIKTGLLERIKIGDTLTIS
jgi:hypothetical protein